jgi:azurin
MTTISTRRGFLKTAALGSAMMAGAGVLAACGGGGAAPTAAPAAGGAPVALEIGSKGDELAYDKAELKAAPGSKVTLTLKNNSQPSANLLHNWALVKAGTGDAVANDGIAAGEAAGYLEANDDRVIAHTKMIKGGESDAVTFDAPAPGTYDFLCTFPGHAVLMKGKFIVG